MTDREVEHLKEVVFAHLDEWRHALELQAHEVERRLTELEQEARRITGLEQQLGGFRGEARALAVLAVIMGGLLGATAAAVIAHLLGS